MHIEFALALRQTKLMMHSSLLRCLLQSQQLVDAHSSQRRAVTFNSSGCLTWGLVGDCHLSTRVRAAGPMDSNSLRDVQLLFQLLYYGHGTVLGLNNSYATKLSPRA